MFQRQLHQIGRDHRMKGRLASSAVRPGRRGHGGGRIRRACPTGLARRGGGRQEAHIRQPGRHAGRTGQGTDQRVREGPEGTDEQQDCPHRDRQIRLQRARVFSHSWIALGTSRCARLET